MEKPLRSQEVIGTAQRAPRAPFPVLGGRYELHEEIGRGGMGRVFAAVDIKLARKVAVKLLNPGEHGPEQLRRFEREARAAASLQQPGILDVFDVGIHQGEPYIVSELLQGETLREKLDRGPLPVSEARDYALQLARALAAAHAGGVVHRDLKPENLFVTRDGRLKILDFGIAKLSIEEAPRTTSGAILGTVEYMAPEQVRGRPVDARADLFSFGAILYEMLSGRSAFRAPTAVETGFAVVSREPGHVHAPADLGRALKLCLRKDPGSRVQSAAELLAVLEGAPVPRRRLEVHRGAIAAAALLLLLLSGPPLEPRRDAAPLFKQVAVLPFRSVGGGTAQEAFCRGLSELLSNKLRRLEQFQRSLRVVPAAEVAREKVAGAREARAAFGATLVLEGSVHWSDGSAVAALGLVETGTQLTLAARDVAVARPEAGRLQALLAEQAAQMLELQLQPEARRVLAEPALSAGGDALYLEARGYLQRYDRMENLESALRALEQVLAVDPGSALAVAARAEAYLRIFQLTRAPEVLALAASSAERASRLGEDLPPVQITLGLVRLARGDAAGAIEALQRALGSDPHNADALRELANAYDAAGNAGEAEATFRRAIELRQGSWAAYKDLGVFYNRHGRLQEAARALEQVAAVTPDSYSAYSNLGGIYLRLGRVDDAAAMLRKSLSLKPTAAAYTNLGSLEYLAGRFSAAAGLLEKAAALNPKDERVWGTLGDSYRFVPGREGDAAAALRRALELTDAQVAVDGGNPQLHARRAIYLSALGEHGRARDELDLALQGAPHDGFVLFRAAIVHQQAGRRDDARRALRAAIQAGWSAEEILHAPPLQPLLSEPEFAQLAAARKSK